MKTFTLALLALGLLAGPAFAHAHLLTAVPADKAVVNAAPTALTLKFSEGVSLKFTGVKLVGPDGAIVKLGTESLDLKNDTLLTVPLEGSLPAGAYSVTWHALATDGHKTNGTYGFTVK